VDYKQALGGSIPFPGESGVLAACVKHLTVERIIAIVARDHSNALKLAVLLQEVLHVNVIYGERSTNMVFVEVQDGILEGNLRVRAI